jgi:hypothetical protein
MRVNVTLDIDVEMSEDFYKRATEDAVKTALTHCFRNNSRVVNSVTITKK